MQNNFQGNTFHVVYEDGDVLAFLDINPSAPGHTVLIPKEHCPDIQRMPDKLIRPVFTAVKRVILLLGETDRKSVV